ncbi:MAG: hypothetical protein QOJ73_852 [Streptosporangiaceae bacterium]|nr:hypothetical protein [Streptosporangiaceae bacterium]
MASAWLDNELAGREQRSELGRHPWGSLQVEASSEDQHWRAERGERCAGGRRVKCSLGGEGMTRILVTLCLSRSPVSLGGDVPAAVEERGQGLPVIIGFRTGGDPFEGGGRLPKPRLVLAKHHDPAPHLTIRFYVDRSPARCDQGKLVHPPLMAHRILHRDIGTSGVPQHVGAVQTKMILQGADVFHQAVAAVAPWIGWYR